MGTRQNEPIQPHIVAFAFVFMTQTEQVVDQIADKRTILWRIGENFAANMLQEQGWHIFERNWKAGRYEVDIIALDPEDVLVFIEIKTRITSLQPGVSMYGLESITYTKRQKIVASANIYLHHNSLVEKGARLDVIVVNFLRKDSTNDFDIHYMDELSMMEHVHSPQATHIKEAFY